MTCSEAELARRCREGSREHLEELVDRYYPAVVNFVSRFLGRRDVASDLAQEVFIKVIRSIGSYDDRASLRTWIFTIAANVCRDELRRVKRRREVLESDGPDLRLIGETIPEVRIDLCPQRRMDRSLEGLVIRKAVSCLPDPHRMTVVLRFFHDMSLKEIAEVSGCSVGTVGSRLHYAIKKLRAVLPAAAASIDGGETDALRRRQASASR